MSLMTVKWVRHNCNQLYIICCAHKPTSAYDEWMWLCFKCTHSNAFQGELTWELHIVKYQQQIICVERGKKTIQRKNTFFFFPKWRNFSCLFYSEAKLLWVWNTNNFEACCGFLWMLNLVSSCFVSIKHISGFSRVKHAGAHRVTPSKFSHVRWWKFGS